MGSPAVKLSADAAEVALGEAQAVLAMVQDEERRGRLEGESFTAFQRRLSDEELGELAGLEPAVKRKVAA